MQTRTAHISAKLHETSRSAEGQVQYVLTATLDPSGLTGFFKDEITMVTNDATGQTIPVAVSAAVRAATMRLALAPIARRPGQAGQVVTKTLSSSVQSRRSADVRHDRP